MAGDRHRPPPPQVAVVMVPLPAQGHLNQLLHLSRLIAAYSIPVHYVSTAAHLRQAKLRLHGWHPATVHFHDFPIPKFESPIPDPNAAIKFPSHLQPLFRTAASHLRQPLAALVRRLALSSRRVAVIHDSVMSSAVQDVAAVPNAECYTFHPISAFCAFWYFYDSLQKPFPVDNVDAQLVPSLQDCFPSEFLDLVQSEQIHLRSSSGNLFNSCRITEGPFLDLIDKLFEHENQLKCWALGPFNPVVINPPENGSRHACLKWLDGQAPKSVVYVSFGTTVSLPEEQIAAVAAGLEESGLKFVWALRDADRGELEMDCGNGRIKDLKLGFSERGILVRDWAPQLEILRHPAIGGFLSHCGWNSCTESLSAGVAVAAWPMHSDQPRNAVLMTEVLKVGVVARDWAERREIVPAGRVSAALRRLMEDEALRRRAEEVGVSVRDAVLREGGATRREMDAFVTHIRR
ncbi:zeatin O-glucosyltransferase-like [Andrographis paniculata]|uniref:zeatin O-glucosyltransferase-like n=1 Tax=Andrographis paniculata TaxID=175694 RepID=UPI0021E75FC4|nr:zeatin O-glucosyltransferase-like [Andrographis paniculata]